MRLSIYLMAYTLLFLLCFMAGNKNDNATASTPCIAHATCTNYHFQAPRPCNRVMDFLMSHDLIEISGYCFEQYSSSLTKLKHAVSLAPDTMTHSSLCYNRTVKRIYSKTRVPLYRDAHWVYALKKIIV